MTGLLENFACTHSQDLATFNTTNGLVARIDESDRLCDRRAFRIGRSQIDRFFQKLQGRLSAERSGSERERNKKQKTSHRIGIENSANEPTDDRTGRPPCRSPGGFRKNGPSAIGALTPARIYCIRKL